MDKLVDVLVPLDQQEGTESVIGAWLKQVGDAVSENEPLVEVSTDKVSVEIAAPATGVLIEIIKEPNTEIKPGDLIGRIKLAAATTTHTKSTPEVTRAVAPQRPAYDSTDSSNSLSLTPAVKRLIKEHNLDPAVITGSGQGGRITVSDVEQFLSGASAKSSTNSSASPEVKNGALKIELKGRKIPHSVMRRKIAAHMLESMTTAPHVTSVFEVDLSAVYADREKRKVEFAKRDVKLTLSAYFCLATARALVKVPEVNSRWHDDGLEVFEFVNLGVGVATGSGSKVAPDQAGLVVPVIRDAHKLDLFGMAAELGRLTELARTNKLEPRELQGGTFTISNHGMSGSLIAAPIIINQPQSAILGIGKVSDRAVVVESNGRKELAVQPRCYITLTIDHRVLDGFKANAFLSELCSSIERGEL